MESLRRLFRDLRTSGRPIPRPRPQVPPRLPVSSGTTIDGVFCQRCRLIRLPIPGSGKVCSVEIGTETEIETSSKLGCRFCTMVYHAFNLSESKGQGIQGVTENPCAVELSWQGSAVVRCKLIRSGRGSEFSVIEIKTDYNGALDSSMSLGTTISDLEDCVGNHISVCSANVNVPLPSRLLDVGRSEQDTIKLVILEDEGLGTGKYAALSYCWGNFPAFTTTPATLDKRCRGMDWAEIPQTLRHAIQVTRHLGLRYLWIDALCILQGKDSDARRDWERESGHMADVYGNAFLTIVALGARDCDGGLFEPRMSSTFPVEGGSRESVTLYLNEDRKNYKDEPLNSRAWALQEWHLSARLLVFTASGPFFHCSMKRGKHFPDLKSGAHRIYWYRLPQRIEKAHPGFLDWRLLVENYCSRSLTDSTDKLPAFSALVRKYHDISGGQNGRYLAGLWESALLGDLLWRHDDAFSGFYAKPRLSKCDKYRAPSWSWASCDRIVTYISYHLNNHPDSYVAKVIECTTDLATADAFGGVTSARLIIMGPSRLPAVDDVLRGKVGSVYFDDDDETGRSRVTSAHAIACLLIQITKGSGYRHGLLLLKESKGDQSYKRSAFICASGAQVSWWGTLKESQFTIV